jgi:23S rRNA (cytosine1962-C5)-methyltransferase
MSQHLRGYALLDSGDHQKLERFGDRVVCRPSSLCAWRPRLPRSSWDAADATYSPADQRWVFTQQTAAGKPNAPALRWHARVEEIQLELELMSNGQLGIFPEHALYLPQIGSYLTRLRGLLPTNRPLKVLNLFAYTGLATVFCARTPNVEVTHVDLAKRAIEWAKRNAQLNQVAPDAVRWIVDDALGYMAREGRKGNRYDIIIIDPPSFSRVSRHNSWTLEEKAPEIITLCLGVLNPTSGVIFFTNHSSASTTDVARNIALDHATEQEVESATLPLSLPEQSSARLLPAGNLIILAHFAPPTPHDSEKHFK